MRDTAPFDPDTRFVRFDDFELDRLTDELCRNGQPVALPGRAAGVLGALLERPGQIVSKEALLGAVWPDVKVTDSSVADAVSQLRQALGDEAQNPRFVRTVHRRGYRFCGEVSMAAGPLGATDPVPVESVADPIAAPVVDPIPDGPEPALGRSRTSGVGLLAAMGLLLMAAAWAISGTGKDRAETSTGDPFREPRVTSTPRMELSEPIPEGAWIDVMDRGLALSPDGSTLTVSLFQDSDFALWQRYRHRSGLHRLEGTDGARSPVYHGDGTLYFLQGEAVQHWPPGAEAPLRLMAAPDASGLRVGADGSLLLIHAGGRRLSRALPPFEDWTPIAAVDEAAGDVALLYPSLVSPDRVRFLRWRGAPERSPWVERSLSPNPAGELEKELGKGPTSSIQVDGRWLWATDGRLELGRRLGAPESVVASPIYVDARLGLAQFDATPRDLVFLAAEGRSRLRVLITEDDLETERRTLVEGPFTGLVASPDGRTLALVREQGDARDLGTLDTASGEERRHTYGAMVSDVAFLSPSELLFVADGGEVRRLDLDDGREQLLFALPGLHLGAELADGSILYSAPDASDRWRLGLARPLADGTWSFEGELPSVCRGSEIRPRLSPDGRFLAFLCDREERKQLFLVPVEQDGSQNGQGSGLPRPGLPDWESMAQVTHDEAGLLFFDWYGTQKLGLITLDLELRFGRVQEGVTPQLAIDRRAPLGPWSAAFPIADGGFVTARLEALEADKAQPVLRWIHGWQSPLPTSDVDGR